MSELTPDKQLLLYLSEKGIGQYREINGKLDELFPPPKFHNDEAYHYDRRYKFLDDLVEHGFMKLEDTFFKTMARPIRAGVQPNYKYPISASITKGGIDYIKGEEIRSTSNITVEGKNINIVSESPGASMTTSNAIAGNVKGDRDRARKIKKWTEAIVGIFVGVGAIAAVVTTLFHPTKKDEIRNLTRSDSMSSRTDTIKQIKTDSIVNILSSIHDTSESLKAPKTSKLPYRKPDPIFLPKDKMYPMVALGINNYTVGTFGGISDLKVTVTNNSPYLLDLVVVEVTYMQLNGKVYKTENLYFRSIQSKSAIVQEAPKSTRGAKIQTKITSVNSKVEGI